MYRRNEKSKLAPYFIETRASHLLPEHGSKCYVDNLTGVYSHTIAVETRKPIEERLGIGCYLESNRRAA